MSWFSASSKRWLMSLALVSLWTHEFKHIWCVSSRITVTIFIMFKIISSLANRAFSSWFLRSFDMTQGNFITSLPSGISSSYTDLELVNSPKSPSYFLLRNGVLECTLWALGLLTATLFLSLQQAELETEFLILFHITTLTIYLLYPTHYIHNSFKTTVLIPPVNHYWRLIKRCAWKCSSLRSSLCHQLNENLFFKF